MARQPWAKAPGSGRARTATGPDHARGAVPPSTRNPCTGCHVFPASIRWWTGALPTANAPEEIEESSFDNPAIRSASDEHDAESLCPAARAKSERRSQAAEVSPLQSGLPKRMVWGPSVPPLQGVKHVAQWPAKIVVLIRLTEQNNAHRTRARFRGRPCGLRLVHGPVSARSKAPGSPDVDAQTSDQETLALLVIQTNMIKPAAADRMEPARIPSLAAPSVSGA